MFDVEIAVKKFKKGGFKLTPQRIAILKTLDGDTSHPGINEIYTRLKKEYPSLSLTTVYNTIEMLKKIEEVSELTIDRTRSRYDPNTEYHDHILCISCKKIEDIPTDLEKGFKEKKINGFNVTGVSNQYYGFCAECQ